MIPDLGESSGGRPHRKSTGPFFREPGGVSIFTNSSYNECGTFGMRNAVKRRPVVMARRRHLLRISFRITGELAYRERQHHHFAAEQPHRGLRASNSTAAGSSG